MENIIIPSTNNNNILISKNQKEDIEIPNKEKVVFEKSSTTVSPILVKNCEKEELEVKDSNGKPCTGTHTVSVITSPWVEGDGEYYEQYLKVENNLSEIKTETSKEEARKNIGINYSYSDITNPENHPYFLENNKNITTVKDALDALFYENLEIINFYCSPALMESGDCSTNTILRWNYNKTDIIKQTINNVTIDPKVRSYSITTPIIKNTTYTLIGEDKQNKITAYSSIKFVPGKYYGTSNLKDIKLSKYIIENFKRDLTLTYGKSFTQTADYGQYIYLLVPKNMSDITFWVNGFEGGFILINDSFKFSRYPNKIEDCCLFRSEKSGLGKTTVTIK